MLTYDKLAATMTLLSIRYGGNYYQYLHYEEDKNK